MPTHPTRRIYEKQICSKVFWFTLEGQLKSEAFHTIPPVWVKANRRIGLDLVPTWRPRSAVGGCGLNEGHGVGSSHNKVEVNNVCTQDLSNTRGVNAPVAGSLRVRQPYGDEDEI